MRVDSTRPVQRTQDGGVGGVLERYGAGSKPPIPDGQPQTGGGRRTYAQGPGSRAGSRGDGSRDGSRGNNSTRPGTTADGERTQGGLLRAGGERTLRPSDNVRAQPGSGSVANAGGNRGGDERYGAGSGGGNGVAQPDRDRGGPNRGVNAGTALRGGDDARTPGVRAPGGGTTYGGSTTRGTGYGPGGVTRLSYDDPAYPRGTASYSPWGYFHRDYGVRFSFGSYCGPSYWFWNVPSYYCWYYPYRFRYWYYPSVYQVYDPSPQTVYVYDNTPQVIYVDNNDNAGNFVDEPIGEGVVRGQPVDGGLLLDDPDVAQEQQAQETLSLAAERYLTLGDEAFRDERYADAVHFYARAIEFDSGSGVLYLVLSDALFATGDYHYAAYALRKAFELAPELVDSSVDKHGFYTDPSDFDRQLAVLENFVSDHPSDSDARLVLAVNLLFGGRPADAVDLLENTEVTRQDRRAERLVYERARELEYGPR